MPIDKDLVNARIRDVLSSISELKRITSKSFVEMSIDEIYSMRYNIIVLVEAVASICLHIAIEQYGLRPRSYSECFREISLRIGVKCFKDLEALSRLRNLLVHRYWVVRDDLVYNCVRDDFKCVLEFTEAVKRLMSK
jgi:uncharacterized protein YutE (UPF0331/DUF86 family)